jgi:hypothetical protein
VVLVGLEKPFLMRRERGAVFLIRASVEGVRKQVAVETHTGFKEGVWALDTIANKGGQLLTALAVGDSEEVSGGMREFFETTLEVVFPAGTGVNARLWLPVFFVIVQAMGPVSGRRTSGERRERGRSGRRRNICAFERQIGVGGKGGNGQWRDEALHFLCSRWDH